MALIALDDEVARRRDLRAQLRALSADLVVPAATLHDLKLKAGERSVYRDAVRTGDAVEGGIALSLHHTGQVHAHDLDPHGIIYPYPRTRQKGHDRADVLAIENAFRQRVPLFVIEDLPRSRRRVHWGWVQYINKDLGSCYVAFSDDPPIEFQDLGHETGEEWTGVGPRSRRVTTAPANDRNLRFRFLVRSRYHDRCPVTGVSVEEMLEAARVVEAQDGGKDVAVNGILLDAGLHRAFEANLWTIEPDTLRLVARPDGPTLREMGIALDGLAPDSVLPAREALEIRWRKFRRLANPTVH
ncbi:MAG: HNH endonuclease [Acidimicrobiales bacterium]